MGKKGVKKSYGCSKSVSQLIATRYKGDRLRPTKMKNNWEAVAVVCLELSRVCWRLQQLGNGALLMGESEERGQTVCPRSLYIYFFIICNVFMVFSPEVSCVLPYWPVNTLAAGPSGLPPLWCLWAARAGAQRQALRVQVLPLNVNYFTSRSLTASYGFFSWMFSHWSALSSTNMFMYKVSQGPDHLRFS